MSISDLHVDGEVLISAVEKANSIADVFGTPHPITLNNISPMDTAVSTFIIDLNDKILDRANIELTNLEEDKSFVFLLKNNKAPGLDGINIIILQKMPDYKKDSFPRYLRKPK